MSKNEKMETISVMVGMGVAVGIYAFVEYALARPYLKEWKEERKEKRKRKGFIEKPMN